jgi:hypothetical protein
MGGFIAGSRDAALKFSAKIGKWQLEVIGLIKFGETGEMIEFEVMIRPIKALQAPGDEMGTGSAAIDTADAGRGRPALILGRF